MRVDLSERRSGLELASRQVRRAKRARAARDTFDKLARIICSSFTWRPAC